MFQVLSLRPQRINRCSPPYLLLVPLLALLGCASEQPKTIASSQANLERSTSSGPTSGSLLVDDFEDGNLESEARLSWIVIADEQLGGNSKARLSLTHPGANGSRAALRIEGNVVEGLQIPFAGVWALTREDGRPSDLSAYRGMRFYARGFQGSYLAGLRYVQVRQGVSFMARFEVRPDWTLVDIPFTTLQRIPSTGPAVELKTALTSALMVGITTPGQFQGEFQVEIDQVELYS